MMEDDLITPDTLFCVFGFLPIKGLGQASLVNRTFHQSSKDYRKTRGLTPSRYRLLKEILNRWKIAMQTHRTRKPVNSWTKKTKDPERPILLF
jgi:hypothetical protein